MYNASLVIRDVTLPSDKTLVSIDYQISKDGNFDNEDLLIVNDKQDTEHLTGKDFLLDFDINDIYYGRVRLNFDDEGNDYYQDKVVVITRDGSGYSSNTTVLATPILTINKSITECDTTGVIVTGSSFKLFKGVGSHKYSNWYIKDSSGNIIWKRELDSYNLTSIKLPDDLLQYNKHYIIEAIYIDNNNQRSNTGRTIVKTISDTSVSIYDSNMVSKEVYDELYNTYEELLSIVVNRLALGIDV